jgi:hypothetical protein
LQHRLGGSVIDSESGRHIEKAMLSRPFLMAIFLQPLGTNASRLRRRKDGAAN